MLPDNEAQEQAVRASDLEWVLIRPPRFVAGKRRGSIRVIREGERGRLGHVVRADLARFIVDCVTTNTYVWAHDAVRGSEGELAHRAHKPPAQSDVRRAIGKDKGDDVIVRLEEQIG
jgi:uncharacterized protein YbjT (DUF2867 family)